MTKTKRSRLMARITGDNLKPERDLWEAVDRETERRLAPGSSITIVRNDPKLPGKPDLALRHLGREPKRDVLLCVFVHGCFWHGCPWHYRRPKTRRSFWRRKLESNQARDRRVRRQLRRLGYLTLVVWEHQVTRDAQRSARRVVDRLVGGKAANA